MIRFRVAEVTASSFLVGATQAEAHLDRLVSHCRSVQSDTVSAQEPGILLVDFARVEAATSSYLRALLLPLIPGRDGAEWLAGAQPVVGGLNEEVRVELAGLLDLMNRSYLEAEKVEGDTVAVARLHGRLDPALTQTLDLLLAARRASATELHAESTKTNAAKITITAWNNRLSELYFRAIARRDRVGKQWLYEPLGREIIHG